MLGNVFLTFYRVTTRHPLYAALDLLGLSFGVAVFVTLSLYVRFETSYESWLPHADEIYQAQTRYTMPGKPTRALEAGTAMLLETLKSDYPDVVGVRIHETDADVNKGSTSNREREELADADFFTLFDLPLVAGEKSLKPGRIMVSQSMALKYLRPGEGVGATIRLRDKEGDIPYVVSAIFVDLPRNSDLHFDLIRLLTPSFIATQDQWNKWGRLPVKTWLRLGDQAQVERLDMAFDDFVDRHLGDQENGQKMHALFTYRLMKLQLLHLSDSRSRSALLTLGSVALLSLVVAAINHVNLATALAGLRAREVAVRRTVGGTRGALGQQFLLEAMLTSFVAWIGGLSLVELALPLLNQAAGLSLSLGYGADGVFFASMMGAVLLLGLLSGIYPAFVLSRFQPAQVLSSSRWPSGGRLGLWIREALVVLQFTVVAVFFSLTWGFFSQIAHLEDADLGFHREGVLLSPSTVDPAISPAQLRQIWAAMRDVPGVVAVGSADAAPGEEAGNSYVVVAGAKEPDLKVSGLRTAIEADFFAAYGANLLAGRFLEPALAGEGEPAGDEPQHVVLNARFAHALGFTTPEQAVGQTLDSYGKKLAVVGVVGDLRFRSPKIEQEGIYYYVSPAKFSLQQMAVRFEGVPEPEMRERLAAAWRTVAGDVPFELSSVQDSLDKYYRPDRIRSRLFGIGAMGAGLIGCLGLYGMAAFGASRRMLELAIRKVLGATRGTVVKLLVARFLRPVLLANLLAAPIAYWVLSQWLVQFEDRIAITPLPFLASGGAVLAIAVLTVAALSFTAASKAPARILHRE